MNEVEIRVTSQNAVRAGMEAAKREVRSAAEKMRRDLDEVSARGLKIDADILRAEAKLRRLEAQAKDATGEKRIQVDADVAAAAARLEVLRNTARRLDDQKIQLQVDLDAAGAEAELGGVNAEVSRLDGRRATVNVDADVGRALAKIGLVTAAIAGIAVASSAAIAGIGGGAALGLVGAGGIAATIGGLSGVGDAVKALGEQTKGAGAAAASAAGQQLQMASALDRVKQAQANLKSTTLDAAAAQRRAQERVADATRALSEAQRRAIEVERELTRAREDARETLEDLALEGEEYALQQRRAFLDVEQAKQALDEVLADGTASQQQRAEAQLALEEAQLRLRQIAEAAEDSAQRRADAETKGIEGSDQVVDAQERIRDAHEDVAEARRNVADAVEAQTEQQRHSAEAIAAAQQQVVEAQRAVQAASIQAGSAGAAGIDKINEAMSQLSPTGQEFARFLRELLDGPIKELRFAAQDGLLPGLQDGLEGIEPMLDELAPAVERFAGLVGDALGGLIEESAEFAPDLLDFISEGLEALAPLRGVLGDLLDELGDVFDRMEADGTLDAAMAGVVEIIDAIVDHIPELVELGLQLMALLGPEFADLLDALIPLLLEMAQALGPLLVEAIRALIPLLERVTAWIQDNPEDFRRLVAVALALGAAFSVLGTIIANYVVAGVITAIAVFIAQIYMLWQSTKRILGFIGDLWDDLIGFLSRLPGRARRALARLWDGIVDRFDDARDAVAGRADRLISWVGRLPGRIRRATAGMWDGIKDNFRSALNWVIDKWNGLSMSVDAPGFSFSLNTPDIPRLATGGIRGGLAQIAERAGELVRLPQGSMVYSGPDTERMLSTDGRRGPVVIELRSSGTAMDDLLVELLRDAIQARGGDVQVVLGTGRARNTA